MNIKLTVLLMGLLLAGCAKDPMDTLDGPKKYFKDHKAGTSPDWGVIKWKDPDDHVITVHGFADDGEACQKVADAMNVDACKETNGQNCLNPFSCVPLNLP